MLGWSKDGGGRGRTAPCCKIQGSLERLQESGFVALLTRIGRDYVRGARTMCVIGGQAEWRRGEGRMVRPHLSWRWVGGRNRM